MATATMNTGVMTAPNAAPMPPATTSGTALATAPGSAPGTAGAPANALSPWRTLGIEETLRNVVNQPSVRRVLPLIMMLVVMVWVVLTGMPMAPVAARIVAAVVSAAKPWTGFILTILWPRVLIMRQPPIAVPAAITNAQDTIIQLSMSFSPPPGCKNSSQLGRLSKVPEACALKIAKAIIPMVFCASLVPCAKPI